jgi:hypothetical protein
VVNLELPKAPEHLPLPPQHVHTEVCDLAINDAATTLHCWGQIGHYGFFHAYDLSDDASSGLNRQPTFSAYFSYVSNFTCCFLLFSSLTVHV